MTWPEFLRTIKAGDLVTAHAYGSSKLHILRAAGHRGPGEGRREVPLETRLEHWKGRGICGYDPGYFWKPVQDAGHRERCPRCFAKWRTLGRPPVKGWHDAEQLLVSALPLPYGWREVSTCRHQLDLREADPDPDPEKNEDEVGAKRLEVWRFVRGTRYVRVVQYLSPDAAYPYGCFAGELERPDTDGYLLRGNLEACLRAAVHAAALGGQSLGKHGSYRQLRLPTDERTGADT